MVQEYRPRIIDRYLEERLRDSGAIVIDGPRWCGKTRTSEEHCRSAYYIRGRSQIQAIQVAIASNSTFFLEGENPRLIDEWQAVPEIWDLMKYEVDHREGHGLFILTGSAMPPAESTIHSGAGRISPLEMRTMTLYESGESNGKVSLESLFDGATINVMSELTVDSLAHAIVRGGWPEPVISGSSGNKVRDYVNAITDRDMADMLYGPLSEDDSGKVRKPSKRRIKATEITKMLLSSISRNLATATPFTTILKDVNSRGKIVSDETLMKYVLALEQMHFLENLDAWNPHIRSKTSLISSPKWHFTDPSIAAAIRNVSETKLLNDLNAMGFYFESMCLRDLRVYSQGLGGKVYYIRSEGGFEVDFVVELEDGRWGAFEVKMGTDEYDKAASNLIKLRDSVVDTGKMGEPVFLAVLTAAHMGYTRADGVHIVPIGCLKD